MSDRPIWRHPGPIKGAGDEVPRLIEDEIVAQRLAEVSELVKSITDDLDQLAADLDDNWLAIASSVAWLVSDSAREVQEATTMLRSRLTFLAGQNIFPFGPDA